MSSEKGIFQRLPLAEIIVPGVVIASLLVMFFNLPGPVMDWLLSLNIALSVLILLTTFFIRKPLDFDIFPTLLLTTTLFRLVLNVASTRLILTRADSLGEKAAGEVIWAFSRFVTGENLVVGIVIFLIFITIQFVVLTKGATRISEVAARFTLDSLPGRQMAIDADLAAGIIDDKEARRRREELTASSDFFGAMDGAGKFVRGDAIASLIIIFVNMIGGGIIGMVQNGRSLTETLTLYSNLTIGDGLAAQIPALLISLATGILVSRGSRQVDFSRRMAGQLAAHPMVFAIGGFFLLFLTLTGLPQLPLICIALGSFLFAWTLNKRREEARRLEAVREETKKREESKAEKEREAGRIENYLKVNPIELEIGIGLVPLAESGEDGLLPAIRKLRESFASEWGVILPKVRIRDSMNLDENRYQIKIYGEDAESGIVWPGMFLAVDEERVGVSLQGIKTVDPLSGGAAFWIEERFLEKASLFGFSVFNAGEALLRHFKAVLRRECARLLTRDAAAELIDALRKNFPHTVDDLIPDLMKLGEVQGILQRLLREGVSIRQLGLILETLNSRVERTKNPILLAEAVRKRLSRTLCAPYRSEEGEIHAIILSPEWEGKIADNSDLSGEDVRVFLAPEETEELFYQIQNQRREIAPNERPVLLVSDAIRPAVWTLISENFPDLAVLSFGEISRDTRVISHRAAERMKQSA